MKILRISKIFEKKNEFENFLKIFFSGFSLLGQETLDMGVFIYLMGSPDYKDLKKYGWMTFKKTEMAKTLRNGLSMFDTNSLNHNRSDFAI